MVNDVILVVGASVEYVVVVVATVDEVVIVVVDAAVIGVVIVVAVDVVIVAVVDVVIGAVVGAVDEVVIIEPGLDIFRRCECLNRHTYPRRNF